MNINSKSKVVPKEFYILDIVNRPWGNQGFHANQAIFTARDLKAQYTVHDILNGHFKASNIRK